MIVPMKKAHIIVQESDRKAALDALSDAGLVHIDAEPLQDNENLAALQRLLHSLEKANGSLPQDSAEKSAACSDEYPGVEKGLQLADEIHQAADALRELLESRDKIDKNLERLAPWGDFAPSDVTELKERGIELEFRVLSKKEWSSRPAELKTWLVSAAKGTCYAVVLYESGQPHWDAGTVVELPETGMSDLLQQKSSLDAEIDSHRVRLEQLAESAWILRRTIEVVRENTEYEMVYSGMEQDGTLCVLTGYIDADSVDSLKATAASHHWGLSLREPDEEDAPPTKLKNPRWIRIIQPVFDLLGTVPGYRENDISALFLLFFAVFFGMIISDAGYGSLLLTIALLFSLKSLVAHKRIPDGLILMMVLSSATVVWGAITGNWFGFEPIARTAPFSLFVIESMDSFDTRSIEFVQLFCFVLGLIHLSLAFLWNTTRALKGPYKLKAVGEIGWLTLVVGLFFLVLNVVLGHDLPAYALYLIIGGFIAVTIFGSQEGNFIKGIGKGLAEFMTNGLSSVSRFSDIVSYIRLFAVGLASIEIAKSFNAMGMSVVEGMGGGFAAIAAGALVIVLGHTINLFMAALSVVVHGVRLNMLEFSGALGMEWTGRIFSPFRAKPAELELKSQS